MAIFRGTGSASATADQTTIDTVTEAVADAEAAQTAAEAAQTAAETAKTNAENLYGDLAAVNTAKTDAETAATTATTKASEASDDAADAQKLALNAVDSQFTLSDGTTTGYSALHYNTQAQLRYDNFDDRYLGAKSTAPTTDNEGDDLITGAMYFDDTQNLMYVWTGSSWVNVTPSSTVVLSQVTDVTANASEVNTLDGITATTEELNYTDCVTSNIQTQLDAKLSAETNDLSSAVTWANVPDANITESSVTQHEAALTITESQISDLQSYLTSETFTSVAQDTTPQLGGDLASNGNDIIMADNDKVLLGTGSDGELFHNGSNTIINDAGTGTLQLQTGGTTHLEVTANGLSVTGQAVQGTVTDQTTNDIDFDMQDGNHFTVVFGGTSATDFAFTNETEGQAGMIFLTTQSGGAGNITIGGDVHLSDADLTAINVAGNYIISYYCPDGTNVYLSASAALTEGT